LIGECEFELLSHLIEERKKKDKCKTGTNCGRLPASACYYEMRGRDMKSPPIFLAAEISTSG
jgi:hypothetical protein